jgi:hypothetical protein
VQRTGQVRDRSLSLADRHVAVRSARPLTFDRSSGDDTTPSHEGGKVTLKRFYPGLGLLSAVCFVASAASLVGLLFIGDLVGKVILGALLAGMAAVGGALWVVKTVLEVGFHLQEQIHQAMQRPDARPGNGS